MVVGAKVCELTVGFVWYVCVNFDVFNLTQSVYIHKTIRWQHYIFPVYGYHNFECLVLQLKVL